MLVKAKWNVKDSNGWHKTGDVFETESDFGDAVEVLEAPKKAEPKKAVPEKEPEAVKAEEHAAKPAAEPAKPKTPSRRKVSK